jgi:tetratricopeptide (TPR) repeat protein
MNPDYTRKTTLFRNRPKSVVRIVPSGVRSIALLALLAALTFSGRALAADRWIEVKSPNVTVVASTGAGMARTLAWQLEQVRSAVKTVWPWAKANLERPLLVFAVANENDMRALTPQYWENRNSVRPVSLLVSSPDHHMLAIRADIRAEGQSNINPHQAAYFSYVLLILDQSLDVDLPPWLTRGLAEVLSNTIVRESSVLIGAPIPDDLRFIQERSRLRLTQLVGMKPNDRELSTQDGLSRFDAQAWALVHMLMYDNKGARAGALNQLFKMLADGTEPARAFREALGPPESLEDDYARYLTKSIYSFMQLNVDVSVKKEGFAQRDVPPAEAAALRSLFYAATNRPIEARAAFAEARKGDAAAETHAAEGLLLERDGKLEEAKAAYEQAAAAGSKSPYAHYRLATLRWGTNPSTETLKGIDQLLTRAVTLNSRHADAYAMLGEVRSVLGDPDALGLAVRATQLQPTKVSHRLVAARILLRQKRPDEAAKVLQAAATLSMSPEQARVLQELQTAASRK